MIQTFLRHALRDGFFHADMHPGNLFVDDAGELVAVDFGIMGRLGPKERRFLAEILYGFITRDYYRTAEVHFEAGYVPRHHSVGGFRAGHPRHRRADPQPHRRRHLDGQAADAAFRGHRIVRHAHAARTAAAAEDHGGGGRRRRARSIPSSTCGRPPSRWCANGSNGISAPPAGSKDAAEGASEIGRFIGNVPGLRGAGYVLDQLDDATRDGLRLAPETVAAIGEAEARRNRWMTVGIWVIALLLAWVVLS